MTYKIQFPQALGCIGQVYNRVIRQVRAVGQTQPRQPGERVHTPVLKPNIGNGRAPREIDTLNAIGSVHGNVRHTTVGNVFTVTQCQVAELGTPDDGTRRQRLRQGLRNGSVLAATAVDLRLVLGVCESHVRLEFGYNPADDASEQVVTNLSTIAEINFFEAFCLLHHFENGRACYVPHAFHAPDANTGAARFGELGKALIGDVKAVADVDVARATSNKGAYRVYEGAVRHFAIELGQVEVVQDVRACGNDAMPVPGNLPQLHQLVEVQVLECFGEHRVRESSSPLSARPMGDVGTFAIQGGIGRRGQVFGHEEWGWAKRRTAGGGRLGKFALDGTRRRIQRMHRARGWGRERASSRSRSHVIKVDVEEGIRVKRLHHLLVPPGGGHGAVHGRRCVVERHRGNASLSARSSRRRRQVGNGQVVNVRGGAGIRHVHVVVRCALEALLGDRLDLAADIGRALVPELTERISTDHQTFDRGYGAHRRGSARGQRKTNHLTKVLS